MKKYAPWLTLPGLTSSKQTLPWPIICLRRGYGARNSAIEGDL
jgi:hypothetical protein